MKKSAAETAYKDSEIEWMNSFNEMILTKVVKRA
jgi:hypothetical protein